MMLASNYPSDFDALGQTITFDDKTIFTSHVEGVESISDITEMSSLEVSGYTTDSGSFYATNIIVNNSTESASEGLRVRGIIESLSYSSFRIAKIDIHFDEDTKFIHIKNGLVLPGMTVVMVGTFAADDGSPIRVFNANSIEALNPDVGEGDHVEVVGVISDNGLPNQKILVDDMIVQITAATSKQEDLSKLVVGMSVDVSGVIDQNGILVADKIAVKH